jgi:hypothetical protein
MQETTMMVERAVVMRCENQSNDTLSTFEFDLLVEVYTIYRSFDLVLFKRS